jgi:hypothetical protein
VIVVNKLALGIALCVATPSLAAERPPPGSALRHEILNALRPSVEAKLGPNVEFVVTYIGVENGWAFVQAEPQRRGGRPINGKAYFRGEWEYMDGLTTTAILRFQYGRWNLIESRVGATDAWYCDSRTVSRFAPCGQ